MKDWRKITLVVLALLVAACADDVVEGPFIEGWQLGQTPCADPAADLQCYDLMLSVRGTDGEVEAECRIFASGDDGLPIPIDEAPDLDLETADHEVAIVESITIELGDMPSFDVELPVVDDPAFVRWQVDCDPGAPG